MGQFLSFLGRRRLDCEGRRGATGLTDNASPESRRFDANETCVRWYLLECSKEDLRRLERPMAHVSLYF